MSIEKRVRLVEQLFENLNLEIAQFQKETKLGCVAGCGKCCTNPDIDASPLEFLPWAFHLFLNGKAETVLNDLNKNETTTCYIYSPLSILDKNNGSCSDYKYRGLICRLFGYGANKDKYGQYRLATCKIIKEGQKESFEKSIELINNGLPVPIFTDYYMNLSQIDFKLGNIIVPINKALKFAIEEVLQYYSYRPMPNGFNNCA
ncbi:Fe-S-cluster oxidoreductase [Flavobacterium sp. 316]|uniref:YkgJ family cysteine cluster protein n=1 Tax=Flavobacterium sediminilitoris TaxID=2024526 RepID=A0ABY4HJ94_9FLAO|nr:MULTISPECIES: YkgJ family cysteine cluster protein [Flavobacterium]KIX22602.1 Fe-S-cluster oxidoreductase [Flavobacterium sp. 316]UOX32909.1 YkgJ family cysteine cluster protein [Flavobacterium sediminilitoris]